MHKIQTLLQVSQSTNHYVNNSLHHDQEPISSLLSKSVRDESPGTFFSSVHTNSKVYSCVPSTLPVISPFTKMDNQERELAYKGENEGKN